MNKEDKDRALENIEELNTDYKKWDNLTTLQKEYLQGFCASLWKLIGGVE